MNATPLPFLSFLSGAVALDNVPVLFDDKSEAWLRYGELRARIKAALTPWGEPDLLTPAKKGLILCALPRTVAGVIAYLAAAASGHAVLLVDLSASRLDLFIAHYKPDWVVLPNAMRPGDAFVPEEWSEPTLFLWRRTTQDPDARVHPDLFLLLQPPGPPESVKTVRLSYTNIAHNTTASIESLEMTKEERPLLIMPLSYSFGLSVLHMALAVGASVLISEQDIKSRSLWDMAQKREATLFAGVPFHYEFLARADLDNLHVPRIKTFWQAGGRMPPERTQDMLRQVTARGGAFYVLYGLTEASPRIACLPLHRHPEKLGAAGRLLRDGHIDCAPSQMIYTGPNVMMGYATGRTDLALGDTQGGQLVIAEQGTLDEDGFLFLAG